MFQNEQYDLKDVIYYPVKDKPLYELNPQDYLKFSEMQYFYVEMTKLFLRRSGIQSHQQIGEFVQQYAKGEHVLLKSFNHIQTVTLNKVCFLINLQKIFSLSDEKVGYDFLQFLKLLCSDFPKFIVIKTMRLIKDDWTSDEDVLFKQNYSGDQFVRSFYINFLYENFLKFVEGQIKNSQSVELLGEKILEYYNSLQIQNIHEIPPLHIIFEVLIQFTNSSKSQRTKCPILPFYDSMMVSKLKSGEINYSEFIRGLYNSKVFQRKIKDVLLQIEKSTNKQREQLKILQDKPEDLFSFLEEQVSTKKKSKK